MTQRALTRLIPAVLAVPGLAAVFWSVTVGAPAFAQSYATAWINGHESRTRLLVGGVPDREGRLRRYAALEIAMSPSWKTYWRQPGSAGGIPPQIEWQASTNLRSLTIEYPAPKRMIDPAGHTIGYKDHVVLPLRIEPERLRQPVVLDLKVFFGVCREICIPAQTAFKVTVDDSLFSQTPPPLAEAVGKIPIVIDESGKTAEKPLPRIVTARQVAAEAGHRNLLIDVHFPGGSKGADLFAESGNGLALAMTEVTGQPSQNTIRYRLPVESDEQWQTLGQHGLVLTMTSGAIASEMHIARP